MSITRLPRGYAGNTGLSARRFLSEEEADQVRQARLAYDQSLGDDLDDSTWVYGQIECQGEVVSWMESEDG